MITVGPAPKAVSGGRRWAPIFRGPSRCGAVGEVLAWGDGRRGHGRPRHGKGWTRAEEAEEGSGQEQCGRALDQGHFVGDDRKTDREEVGAGPRSPSGGTGGTKVPRVRCHAASGGSPAPRRRAGEPGQSNPRSATTSAPSSRSLSATRSASDRGLPGRHVLAPSPVAEARASGGTVAKGSPSTPVSGIGLNGPADAASALSERRPRGAPIAPRLHPGGQPDARQHRSDANGSMRHAPGRPRKRRRAAIAGEVRTRGVVHDEVAVPFPELDE